MKNLIKFKRKIYLFFLISGTLLLTGCMVYQPYSREAVSVPDIVQLSKDGNNSKEIIKKIRRSHSVYNLKADQLAKLQSEGVSDSVINYMEKTHMDAIRRDQMYEDSGYGWPGYYGYWYGSPYYGWPGLGWGWNWGPGIIIEDRVYRGGGGHGFHGGGHRN